LSDVTLDFWGISTGNWSRLTVSWSVDGASWRTLLQTTASGGDWRHYSADLDADRAAAGWTYSRRTQIRFRDDTTDSYNAGAFSLDGIRVATGIDVFGPRVAACSLAGQTVAGPVAGFTVTFDEPIDPATFTAGDVSVTSPSGSAVSVASVTDSGDHTTFTVALAAPQGLAGDYDLAVGPALTDALGNDMDQNGDGIPGDGYGTAFTVATTVASLPFAETFEAGSVEALRSCWSFTTDGGAVAVAGHARDGAYGLDLSAPYLGWSNSSWQRAVLHVDLSGQSGVVLDFWALEFTNGGRLTVDWSVDGTNWRTLKTVAGPVNGWRRHWLDLDADLAAAGWVYSEDVRIRFGVNDPYMALGFALDGVRVEGGSVLPQTAAAVPYSEGFETADIADLGAWWAFADEQNAWCSLTAARSHGGTRSLELGRSSTSSYLAADGVLTVDLAPGGTPLSDVTLDFWGISTGNWSR
ncbi:MAG TPA: Ig-like domain-containing protein, partial [Mycobacterium sp.]|nr:Ig-like domain-containing protein [Mycobacterium sp.]